MTKDNIKNIKYNLNCNVMTKDHIKNSKYNHPNNIGLGHLNINSEE